MAAGLCLSVLVALSVLSGFVYSAMLPGAPERADITDPEVINAAQFAVSWFNQHTSQDYLYKLKKILKAQSQVVAGIRYILQVEMGKTPCKKNSSETQSCDIILDPKLAGTYLCDFTVLNVPWEKIEILYSSSCVLQPPAH